MIAPTPKTIGEIAFDAAQDEWWGWDTYDDGEQKEDWRRDLSELDRKMWESGAEAVVKTVVPADSVVVNGAEMWAKIEAYTRLVENVTHEWHRDAHVAASHMEGQVTRCANDLRAALGLDPLP